MSYNKPLYFVLTFLFFSSVILATERETSSPIKNVVVLMMENRAFDHMLGYLHHVNSDITGLTGDEFNLLDPSDPDSEKIYVNFHAEYDNIYNPGHSLDATENELWGSNVRVDPAPMNGFAYEAAKSSVEDAKKVMWAFNDSSLPTLSTLALEFSLFDHWFSSVPANTEPNRMYALSGTSHGATDNNVLQLVEGYPQRSIFDDLEETNTSWKVYFRDFPIALCLKSLRQYPNHVAEAELFFSHAKAGTLPQFSWLEPRFFDFLLWMEEDQHPHYVPGLLTGNVANGEFLIKEVYEALRNSPQWNSTLFIVMYDEHGGFHDHLPPPQKGIPNPDGINSEDPFFDFQRLGVRVPFVAISPWIEKGIVVHDPEKAHYDHTSLLGTVRKILEIPKPPLTKREEWAATFEHIISRSTPRTDCPTTLPVPKGKEDEYKLWKKRESIKETEEAVARLLTDPLLKEKSENSARMSDLQQNIIAIAQGLTGGDSLEVSSLETTFEGAKYIRKQMKKRKNQN
eukprot:TRINITY_DN4426_c0_g1_i1.p1 TRINITY_DN4426_c0_g1~~TRINITY_DN4426_c0_g1_i1.p1  ORF type:complete len:512 (-),score=107.82 TRINITY_DN4426_c0_g1_i1:31-1566(-)